MDISKHDWKLFRERIGEWQGRYMEKLCGENNGIAQLRRGHPGVQIDLTKDQVPYNIVALLRDGTIDGKDLEGFSPGLKEMVAYIMSL